MYEEKIISGKEVSALAKQQIAQRVAILAEKGIVPKLSVVIVGENPASWSYVKGIKKSCAEMGIESEVISLPQTVSQQELIGVIEKLNVDKAVHGILVQFPMPEHIDEYAVINAISSEKDVDGFTAINVGNLNIGKDCFVPCTPQACVDMLEYAGVDVVGKDVVVIGRSNTVGRPVATLLTQKSATVTICHTKTRNIAEKTRMADIIIIAIGVAGFLKADMIKEGAVIIDVGINQNAEGKLCGDADFDSCIEKAGKITPVPGGVGLATRGNLLKNTLKSAENVEK
ncbi:MAG: bifunctional 5,10-methylene-tetrahydrofolate dehydrogenase/5,10-methylene-tetrahydrofolate cyclohydrolase [Oscillospiraceae bacterium]|nr:bifunctional 5,10-methylene-tetrahydrofolate dehydrogenase/5,10-methylene-tetrahydrofolate cyclohydrolase [Oscillospiraceae bacterium]